jgi:predicted amidohydrolase YtcJ
MYSAPAMRSSAHMLKQVCMALLLLSAAACSKARDAGTSDACDPNKNPCADTIYQDAIVETMVGELPGIQNGAVAIASGRIIGVGPQNEIAAKYKQPSTTMHLMGGRGVTILPGFIDSHSHMLGLGAFSDEANWWDVSSVNVFMKPVAGTPRCPVADPQKCFVPVTNQQDVNDRIKAVVDKSAGSPAGTLLTFFNYDPSRLGSSKTCNQVGFSCRNFENGQARKDLDQLSTRFRIMVTSESGHIVYVNTPELERLNICAPNVKPSGATPCHEPSVNLLLEEQLAQSGQLDEDLALWAISQAEAEILARGNKEQNIEAMFKRAIEVYQRHGFTLIQEGAADAGELLLYDLWTRRPEFPFTVAALVYDANNPKNITAECDTAAFYKGLKNPNLIIEGVKVYSDGSNQGFTGFLLAQYLMIPPPFQGAGVPQPYRGLPDLTISELQTTFKTIHDRGFPAAVHQNGDQEIPDVLAAMKAVQPGPSPRNLMIHFAAAGKADLDVAKTVGGVTFLIEDLYYFGTPMCEQVVGPTRAARLYPAADAVARNMRIGLHSDTPVTPPYPLFGVWVANTRAAQQPAWYTIKNPQCQSATLGADQAISIKQGIKAYTSDAAWLYGLENDLGTLEENKTADLVILSADPVTASADQLKSIRVEATVHRGKYFQNPDPTAPIWPD